MSIKACIVYLLYEENYFGTKLYINKMTIEL